MNRRMLVWMLGGLAALALAWLLPAPAQLWARATALPPTIWTGAAAGMALSYALRAARLRDEWNHRLPVQFADCLHITLMHSAAINVLPMRAGELGFPWLLYRRWGIALHESAASLFWLRLQDAIVIGVFALAVFGPDFGADPSVALAARTAVAAALLALVALRGGALAAAALAALASDAGGGSWPARALRRVLQSALRSHARGWLWTIANWLVKLGVLALLLHEIAGVSTLAAWGGALAGEGAAVMPLQPPAGLGTYEAGVWAGVHLAGAGPASPSQASSAGSSATLGAAFTMHLFVIVFSVLAAVASHWLQGAPGREERTS